MSCDKYTEWLSAALDGELTADQRRELDAHLASCPDCAALFETLSANSRAMRDLDCEFPEGLHDRIMSSLPAQAAPVKKNNVIRWKRWASLAACLVLVAAAALAVPGLTRGGKSAAPEAAAQPPSMETSAIEAAPGNASGVYHYGSGQDSTIIGESNRANNEEEPQPTLVPERAPIDPPAAPSTQPSDNGFGNRIPVSTPAPGIGGLEFTHSDAQYLRVGYGYTPPPSARVISSASSLEEYLKGFGTNRFDENGTPVPYEALEQLKETYTDEYFSDHCLVAVVVESGSGSTRYEVVSVNDDTVNIRAIVPEIGTADMAAWLIVVELDEMLDDGTELNTNFLF